MKYGSLFSGAGLGDFGFEMAGLEVAWQCEFDKYARQVLDLRWPGVKKYDDIRTINTEELEKVDLITGGFPCQPFSVAGKQHGKYDDRNLWPEMLRIIKAVKPRYVVAENVPGIIPLYLDTVLADLGDAGYTCWPFVFSSHSLGAWHKRERLWVVAHAGLLGSAINEKQTAGVKQCGETLADSKSKHSRRLSIRTKQEYARPSSICEDVPDSTTSGLSESGQTGKRELSEESGERLDNRSPFRRWWSTEPELGRVAHGVAKRVDRLKCLGNGQTPCSTFFIANAILEYERKLCQEKPQL